MVQSPNGPRCGGDDGKLSGKRHEAVQFDQNWATFPHPEKSKEREGFSQLVTGFGKQFSSIGRPAFVAANLLSWR